MKHFDLIAFINSNNSFDKINEILGEYYLDIGRVILFFIIVALFFILNFIIYKKLYSFLKAKILEKEDETDDILLNSLEKTKRPLSFIVNTIGFQYGLNILLIGLNNTIVNILYSFIVINIVYIIFIFIDNTILFYFTKKTDSTIRKELINLIIAIVKILVLFIGILVILVKFGINISGILASLGIGGLAVALAAKDTLSNFFGLIKMITDKSFSIGDWIKVDNNVEGTVVTIGFISTKIRTFDNALVTVPNSVLANSSIKNWNRRRIGRRIKLNIGVTYNSKQEDLKKALYQIKTMLQEHPGIITSNKIDYKQINKFYLQEQKLTSFDDKYGIKTTLLVFLDNFNDSSIDILIYTFTKTTSWEKWLEVKEDILFKIWGILEQNNLEFAFPSQSIYIEKS